MKSNTLAEWKDFCLGHRHFGKYHFESMFIESFEKTPLPESEIADINFVFSFFENGASVAHKLKQVANDSFDMSHDEIRSWTIRDLNAKSPVLLSDEAGVDIRRLIDSGAFVFATTKAEFDAVKNGSVHLKFMRIVGEFVQTHVFEREPPLAAIQKCFYPITFDFQLAWLLTVELLGLEVDFSNYFPLHLAGADYAIGEESISLGYFREFTDLR